MESPEHRTSSLSPTPHRRRVVRKSRFSVCAPEGTPNAFTSSSPDNVLNSEDDDLGDSHQISSRTTTPIEEERTNNNGRESPFAAVSTSSNLRGRGTTENHHDLEAESLDERNSSMQHRTNSGISFSTPSNASRQDNDEDDEEDDDEEDDEEDDDDEEERTMLSPELTSKPKRGRQFAIPTPGQKRGTPLLSLISTSASTSGGQSNLSLSPTTPPPAPAISSHAGTSNTRTLSTLLPTERSLHLNVLDDDDSSSEMSSPVKKIFFFFFLR